LIKESGPSLDSLREGATIRACRWEFDVPTSDQLSTGHLDFANQRVVRMACLAARQHVRQGRGREALDDLFAGLTLAHRIGTGGVLIARIFENNGEWIAFQTLGRILPILDAATLDDVSRRLDALPSPEAASATVGPESRFVVAALEGQFKAAGPKLGDEDWRKIDLKAEEVASLRKLVGDDRAALLAHLADTGPAFAELARRLDLPWPDYKVALDEFDREHRATDPIVAGLVDAVSGTREVVNRMTALRSMARAGLALVRGGEAAFATVDDPFGDGPHGLKRSGKGYLIRSSLVREGERHEVTLAIGDTD
jgi:hypothetical protein